ncbi:MAG TPA: Ig-like domain-containing protein, partial [Rubrobacteraceae bacterium]|nr:Ig-like domain-containing protein [Rubrobacteraceae bacterium]
MMENIPVRMTESNAWRLVVAATITMLFMLAAFALDAHPAFAAGTVSVSVQGRGDTSGPGITCNESGGPDCSESYADTTFQDCDPARKPPCITITEPPSVTLTAGADRSGYAFDSWIGCDTPTGRNCDMTVTADRSVAARFRDAQAPSVSGLSPASGVQRGTINISASASDNSGTVSRVEFRVRGVLVATDTSAPYSASFDTASVADGPASIRATAFDAAGNISSVESSITID